MNISLKTLGCRLNEAELEQWAQDFHRAGHALVEQSAEADIVVLNSCAVTTEASRKSRQQLHRIYRDNPQAKLIVSGCHATLHPEKTAQELGVDLVIPNADKDQLVDKVLSLFPEDVMPKSAMQAGENTLFTRGRHRAFIKIQDGCRYRCTFCIVTIARGNERSRSIPSITDEINQLYAQGIQEAVLTGVHVGGYGSDNGSSLYTLVKTLLSETDIPRLRFASVEPWDLPDDFFSLFSNPRLMPHMHLPLQSGSDAILKRMSRRCRTADFRRLVEQARIAIPDFNVTTDVIIGFPGETDAQWQESLDYIESINFGHLHIFNYSPREGTKAARLPNPVTKAVKKQRYQQLQAVNKKCKKNFMDKQLNKTVKVLWERSQTLGNQKFVTGYTPNYLKVTANVSENTILSNCVKNIKLVSINNNTQVLEGLFEED